MKALRFLIASATMLMATTIQCMAQNFLTRGTEEYSRIYIDYATNKEHYSINDCFNSAYLTEVANDDAIAKKGFNLGYLHATNITGKKLPVFVEYGGELGAQFYSKDGATTTVMRVAVPINLTYKFETRNGWYFAPYGGIRITANILWKLSYDGGSRNYLSDDDMGDASYSRIQFGEQVGLNVGKDKFNFAIGYQWNGRLNSFDYNGGKETTSSRGWRIGFGYNF